MTLRTLLQILVELMVLNIAFSTEIFMNRTVYSVIRENQIVLQPLKGMFFIFYEGLLELLFLYLCMRVLFLHPK